MPFSKKWSKLYKNTRRGRHHKKRPIPHRLGGGAMTRPYRIRGPV